jgi:hypothetical protein
MNNYHDCAGARGRSDRSEYRAARPDLAGAIAPAQNADMAGRHRRDARWLLIAVTCLAAGGCATGGNGGGAGGSRSAAPRPPATGAPAPASASPSPSGAATGWAHSPADETYQVAAEDVADEVRRKMLGIATLAVGLAADGQESALPVFDKDGNRFIAAGAIQLAGTRPISAFRLGTDAVVDRGRAIVRRYPVLGRQGMYIKVALDPAGRRTTWLRRTAEGAFPDSVVLFDLNDEAAMRCYQLDLFFLTGARERKVFENPDATAKATLLAATSAPGAAAGLLDADIVPLKRQGNFLQIAALRGLDETREPLGWVELKDAQGRLGIWFTPGPNC